MRTSKKILGGGLCSGIVVAAIGCSSFEADQAVQTAAVDAGSVDSAAIVVPDGAAPGSEGGSTEDADADVRCTIPTASLSNTSGVASAIVLVAGNQDWVNLDKAVVRDDNSSVTNTLGTNATTGFLTMSELKLQVPFDATITGVSAEIVRGSPGGVVDGAVRLFRAGTPFGLTKVSVAAWPSTDAPATYGSSTDLWGVQLTPAEVNAGEFGVGVSAHCKVGGTQARVDAIAVTVHFCR